MKDLIDAAWRLHTQLKRSKVSKRTQQYMDELERVLEPYKHINELEPKDFAYLVNISPGLHGVPIFYSIYPKRAITR